MKVLQHILARGNRQIVATHKTTLELTKETHVSSRGDCILAVAASKGASDLSEEFKRVARDSATTLNLSMTLDDMNYTITGRGNPQLTFEHLTDIVVRRSGFTCPRTLMVYANKAAADIPREFIKRLRDPQTSIEFSLAAER